MLDSSAFVACFDGAARFNGQATPSIAGAGVVVACPTGEVRSGGVSLGDVSNNVAEFTSLVMACQMLVDLGANRAVLVGDSQLVISALNGSCTIRHPALLPLLWTARCWLASIGSWVALHVPRAHNGAADHMANEAATSGLTSISLRQPLWWAVPRCAPGMLRCTGHDDRGMFPPALCTPPEFPLVLAGQASPSAADLWFRNVDDFRAGNLHLFPDRWAQICSDTPNGRKVMSWAAEGVRAADFFAPFRGKFMGRSYDSRSPPRASFKNHNLPEELEKFVDGKIAEEVRAGAARVWGAVGAVEPPHLVLPIGVEPSKPRKLLDARFLNLWCIDVPFKFEGLQLVPDLTDQSDYAFNVDHSSGYWHVALTQDSWTYFGFQWRGMYYVYTVLSFGWKIAPMIYNSFSGEMVGFTRRIHLRSLYLLDDSLGLSLRGIAGMGALVSAHAAVYIFVGIMVGLGYFVHPSKSVLSPAQMLEWLGLLVDFRLRRFLVPPRKLVSIHGLVTEVLSRPAVMFKTLERLVGKCGSLYLAVPGAHVMLRQCYAAMGNSASVMTLIPLSPLVRRELESWLNVEKWCGGVAGWALPHHFSVVIHAAAAPGLVHASFSAPAGKGVAPFMLRGGDAPGPGSNGHTNRESVGDAVLDALSACLSMGKPRSCFVDILLGAGWHPGSVLSRDLSSQPGGDARAGRLLGLMTAYSIVAVNVIRIPDPSPLAWFAVDKGSFVLSGALWRVVDDTFGPHDVDAMSSDSNAQLDPAGGVLPHFTRWPSPLSSGVNVFSQALSGTNIYCNAVFSVISPLIAHFRAQRAVVSLVVPGWYGSIPGAPWWPQLAHFGSGRLLLARAGDAGVFTNLQQDGSWLPAGPVPWDVWVYRLNFSEDPADNVRRRVPCSGA